MSLETEPNLETNITDITITTDGRIRCFGLSRELLELLCESGLADQPLRERLEALKHCNEINSSFEILR